MEAMTAPDPAIMEAGTRTSPAMTTSSSPTLAAADTKSGTPSAGQSGTPSAGESGSSSTGFAGIAAKMMGSKVTVKGETEPRIRERHGCIDDLPLGSEAYSLSRDQNMEPDIGFAEGQAPWLRRASQGMMGWQSFNSDLSNHTSASSASLEHLLNERQVDPEEMLLSLGFGGEAQGLVPSLARIPLRFLKNTSLASGQAAPENRQGGEDVNQPEAAVDKVKPTTAPVAAKKHSAFWTLARSLSMLQLRKPPTRGAQSPASSAGLQSTAGQPTSILHPLNQKYLASRGYYQKQGWPKGSFVESENNHNPLQPPDTESSNAASRRKNFQKTKSRRNWSMCDSGESERVHSCAGDWQTKSVDDCRGREDSLAGDDSAGRAAYFSTTTESSTDSLDTPNIETEREFEKIRREYNESRKQLHSSSDDLFLPNRAGRLASADFVPDQSLLLSHSPNYFVSPASSRQTTVEKAPTISDSCLSINTADDLDKQRVNFSLPDSSHAQHSHDNANGEVSIVISNMDIHRNKAKVSRPDLHHEGQSSRLMVGHTQTASSDSGSSSCATAVPSVQDPDQRLLSESENSVSAADSISRAHSPLNFSGGKLMVSSGCQTSDSDFSLAALVTGPHSASALNTGQRSTFRVQVSRPAVANSWSEKKSAEIACLEQSPKVQLSTLPAAVNHIELLRRLQNSQNDLSRMGSIQSDSSGFGDTDAAVESALSDPDKPSSVGSSCRTLTCSANGRGEMSTQTSMQSGKTKACRHVQVKIRDGSSYSKQSPRPEVGKDQFVSMCYIPALATEGLRHRGQSWSDLGSTGPADWTTQAGNKSRPSARDLDLTHSRPWPGIDDDDVSNHRKFMNLAQQHDFDVDDWPRTRHDWPDSRSNQTDPLTNMQSGRQSNDNWKFQPVPRHTKRNMVGCKRMFTSQVDLFKHPEGFSWREVSPSQQASSCRRHSEDFLLNGRNDAPLSIELAQARGSGTNSSFSSPSSVGPDVGTHSAAPRTFDPTIKQRPQESHSLETHGRFFPLAGNIAGFSSHGNMAGFSSHFGLDSNSRKMSGPTVRQRSCDILEDDLDGRESVMSTAYPRMSDDFDTYSPVTENSSDFSVASEGQARSNTLDSRKLARLINQPVNFRGTKRSGSHYRPHQMFKDWGRLSRSKQLEEETRLMRHALQKYRTDLTLLEASFMVDYQAVYDDMTDQEREEVEELECLWNEVKGQVMEMEHLLSNRTKSVRAGNQFFSLMSSLGVIGQMGELIKEQICQQQLASFRSEDGLGLEDEPDMFGQDDRHNRSSSSWLRAAGPARTDWMYRKLLSSSTPHLPADLNISLEQLKLSVLSEVKHDILESTKKLEEGLKDKDLEIQMLKKQLMPLPDPSSQPKRWTPRSTFRADRVITQQRAQAAGVGSKQETHV